MNAANEVANEAFRAGRCGFTDVDAIVEGVMDATNVEPLTSLGQVAEVDSLARAQARELLERLS